MSAVPVHPAADQQTARSHSVGGAFRAMLATLCWSSSALLIDRLTTVYGLSSLEISMWRVLMVLPILGFVVVVRRPKGIRLHAGDLVLYGLAGAGITMSNLTWAISVHLNKPAAAAALSFSAPAFIALGERILFKTRILPLQVGAIAVNLVGCGLASGVQTPAQFLYSPAGLLVGLSNGLAFALYTLLTRGRTPRHGDPLTNLFIVFVVAYLGILVCGLPVEHLELFHLHLDSRGWILLLAVGVGPTLLAYAFYNSALRLIPATIASLVTTLEPPIVAVAALVLLGRSINTVQWIGVALIVLAVLAMQLAAARLRAAGRKRAAGPA